LPPRTKPKINPIRDLFRGSLKLPIENYFLDYFVILTLSQSPELMRRVSEGEESHPFFHLRDFSIRDSSGRLAPQNDGMGSRRLFSIGNFRGSTFVDDTTKFILLYSSNLN